MKKTFLVLSITAMSLTGFAQSKFVKFSDEAYIPPAVKVVYADDASASLPIAPYSEKKKIDESAQSQAIASVLEPKAKPQFTKIPSQEAARLAASKRWEETGTAEALVGAGGSIEYPYGYARPVITCAPLHVCSIALQNGESITSVSLGDSVRWMLQTTSAGDKPVMAIKPAQAGLSTNLMVTTDKGRIYYMHLVSSKTEYTPMVNWYDPAAMTRDLRAEAEATARKKAELEAFANATKLAAEQAKSQRVVADNMSVGALDPTTLDFNYVCEGDALFKPSRVFSNETHTFIQLPPEAKTSDAPAVFNITNNQTELLNSRLVNGYYIIDGKPQKLSLVLGVGDKAQTVKCEKKVAKGFFWSSK